jgi:hypothetical protein
MSNTYFKAGSWNAHCDVCGFRFKAYQLKKRWDGLMTCEKDFEQDHPQKYLRVSERSPAVPWVRKQSDDTLIGPACDFWTSSPMADFGVADCAYVGGNTSIERLIEMFRPFTSSVAAIAITGYSIAGVV